MTIFIKAKVIRLLNDKIKSLEIKSFIMTHRYLGIQKSKRSGVTLNFNDISGIDLILLLKKKTPKPQDISISEFYKIEIKKLNDSR